MSISEQERIARMDWSEVEDRLQSATRSRGGAGDARAMREFYGDEEFEALKKIADDVRKARSRGPQVGTVVVLPGIMGSNLITTDGGGDEDLVWVNVLRLALGRVSRLRLDDKGAQEADSAFRVTASVIDKRTYTRLLLKLSARWNVRPFPFDWRKDIKSAADALDKFLKDILSTPDGGPIHLVAHSMGGLVSRYFIHLHKDTWDALPGDGQGQRGRLVMMGTPNYGSFTIPQVMTGAEKLVQWLARVDLRHGLTQLLDIINTFVGSYQMLPDQEKLAAGTPDLYSSDTWGDFTVSQTHLGRARAFHDDLRDPATINPDRMTYIAGCNRRTLSGISSQAPGEFGYVETLDGDGRVPHRLGLLDGVTTYYVEEDHGSLPRNDKVMTAVEQLLNSGVTSALPRQPIAPRGFLPEGARWSRGIGEHLVGFDLEEYARKATRNELTSEEKRVVEETLTRALVGDERPARPLEKHKEEESERAQGAPDRSRLRLKVTVAKGDVTKVVAPVVAVGQYKGVAPAGGVQRLDEKLGYLISGAIKRSMVGSELGQLFFIPIRQSELTAKAVLLAGMGEDGKFSQDDLRYLMHNVTYGIAALGEENFATLLIGSGQGNLSLEKALRGLLFGICDAFHALYETPEEQGLKRVIIVEHNDVRFKQVTEMLNVIKSEDSAGRLDIDVDTNVLPAADEHEPERPSQDAVPTKFGPRITVERDGDLFRFSALTQTAVIPVREVDVQSFFADGIARDLMFSTNKDEQETYGRLLNTVLLPEDFSQVLNTSEPLTLVVDGNTASFPWEMACFATPSGSAYFGTNLSLTRQFRTFLSGAPGVAPPLNDTLRVLVIADPAPEPEYQLPGARAEGRAVVRVLNYIKNRWNLKIDVVDRIGYTECDPVRILGLILEGGFDVVHYAGHGTFDEKNPTRGGWVFGANSYLTAREIFRARRVPRLIFANACFSAVVNKSQQLSAAEMNRHLAGIAEAFFERGVQNYIGAGWPVQDDLAVNFATTFYEYALTGQPLDVVNKGLDLEEGGGLGGSEAPPPVFTEDRTLGQALRHARERIIHNGSTWGAYHHYGNANDFLLHPNARGEALPDSAAWKVGASKKSARKSPTSRKAAKSGKKGRGSAKR